jgi:hypothetical protein
MHKWDRRLQTRLGGVSPVAWSMATDWREQEELRSQRWRRTSQGWYVPAHVELSAVQRIQEAHALITHHGAIGGWAAAHMHGAPFFEGVGAGGLALPVLLCVLSRDTIRRRPGVELLRGSLPASDVTMVHGIRCTTPLRTAFDLARRAAHPFAAVAAVETLVECGLITVDGLDRYAKRHPRWRGIGQARWAVDMATEGVWSPQETWMRLTWEVSAGLPGLLVNRPVFDLAGSLLGIADALDLDSATVLEYDGEDHLAPDRAAADAERDRRFESHGLRTVRVAKGDFTGEARHELISRMRMVHDSGLARDLADDRWTIDRPVGWTMPGQDATRGG